MAWVRFMDMHSGGSQKLEWPYIYIETIAADNEDGGYFDNPARREAESVFYSKFSRNPNRVTCTCCGKDYSISVEETLEAATAFERGCDWDKEEGYIERQAKYLSANRYQTLGKYVASKEVKVVYKEEVTDADRASEPPGEGYVWVG